MATHTFNLAPVDPYWTKRYGITYESAEVCKVTGPRVHNRTFSHKAQIAPWGIGLVAQSTVIASTPVERPPVLGEPVREGDTVVLVYPDGRRREMTVAIRTAHDPDLIDVAPFDPQV